MHVLSNGAVPRTEFVSIQEILIRNGRTFAFQSNLGNRVMAHKISAVRGAARDMPFGLGFDFPLQGMFEAALCVSNLNLIPFISDLILMPSRI